MTAKLPLHEWCIIVLFCLVLLALAGFAWLRPKPVLETPSFTSIPAATALQIKIEGQVAKPGLYRFPLKTTLKQLLEQIEPLPSADLSKFNRRRKLHDGQTLYIPERHPINIEVSGAVLQPGPLQILSGTRCCELADQLQALPEADLNAMRKKRGYIQEGDVIKVAYKKISKSKQK